MCNQNNLTQSSLRETTQRINTLFIFIFFDFSPSRAYFIIPLLYFFKKLVCYAPTHFFAWLCSTLQITHTHRTPREHCTTTTPIKTQHLFDKTSPEPSSTDQLHLNQSPRHHFGELHAEFISRVYFFVVTTNFSPSVVLLILLFLFCIFLLVHTFWSFPSFL